MLTIVVLLFSYLLGSISFAVLSSKVFGLADPRTFGSKNPGATNMLRTGKKLAALTTLLGDAAKGWLAVYLAFHLAVPAQAPTAAAVAAVGVFTGHLFPVFFGFHGGKGVATMLGVALGLNVWFGLLLVGIWITVFALFRISSLAALVAAAVAPFAALAFFKDVIVISLAILSIALIWRHRANIAKLMTREEGRFRKPKADTAGEVDP